MDVGAAKCWWGRCGRRSARCSAPPAIPRTRWGRAWCRARAPARPTTGTAG